MFRMSSPPVNDAVGFGPEPTVTEIGFDGTSATAGPVPGWP